MEDQQAKEIPKVPPTVDRIPSGIWQGIINQECDNSKEENSIPRSSILCSQEEHEQEKSNSGPVHSEQIHPM